MGEKYDLTKMFENAEIKPIPNRHVELLPCPFCGAKMIQLYDKKQCKVGWEHPQTYDCVLGCVGRDCEGLYIAPHKEELWNTRTPKERGGEK